MSAVSYVEAAVVVDSDQNPVLSRRFDELLRDAEISVEPVTWTRRKSPARPIAILARDGHRAGLNFGDCFSYALAKEKGEPLLFKGDDFRHTDIEPLLEA